MDQASTHTIENIINLPNHDSPQHSQLPSFPGFDVLRTNFYEDPKDYHHFELVAARDTFPSPGSFARPQTPDPKVPLAPGQRPIQTKRHVHQTHRHDQGLKRESSSDAEYTTHDHGIRQVILISLQIGHPTNSSSDGDDTVSSVSTRMRTTSISHSGIVSGATPTPALKAAPSPWIMPSMMADLSHVPSTSAPPGQPPHFSAPPSTPTPGNFKPPSLSVPPLTPTPGNFKQPSLSAPPAGPKDRADESHSPFVSLPPASETTQMPDQSMNPVTSVRDPESTNMEPYVDISQKVMPVKAKDLEDVRHWIGVGEEASIRFPPEQAVANFRGTPPAIGDVFTYQCPNHKKIQAWIFRSLPGKSKLDWHDITKALNDHTPMIPHPTSKGFCLWLRDDYTPNYIKQDTYKSYLAKTK